MCGLSGVVVLPLDNRSSPLARECVVWRVKILVVGSSVAQFKAISEFVQATQGMAYNEAWEWYKNSEHCFLTWNEKLHQFRFEEDSKTDASWGWLEG